MDCLPLTLALWLAPFAEVPHPSHLDRFPPVEECLECGKFAAGYVEWLKLRAPAEWAREQQFSDALADAERCRRAWELLHCAHHNRKRGAYTGECKEQLGTLRFLIGPEAYAAGRMPPCVPLWWFTRID